jgi:hypothetical protein
MMKLLLLPPSMAEDDKELILKLNQGTECIFCSRLWYKEGRRAALDKEYLINNRARKSRP